MEKYIAEYGAKNFINPSMPEIRVEFPWRMMGSLYALILADEVKVKVLNNCPKPEFNGIETTWGALREKLWVHDTERLRRGEDNLKFEVEILHPLWRCLPRGERIGEGCPRDPREIMESLSHKIDRLFEERDELSDKVTRRNQLTEDLRKENRKLRERLVTLGKKK